MLELIILMKNMTSRPTVLFKNGLRIVIVIGVAIVVVVLFFPVVYFVDILYHFLALCTYVRL